MIDLTYSLIIEATEDPDFFGFSSQELEGFTGVGHSIKDCLFKDCLYKVKWGMQEHGSLLEQQGLPVPSHNLDPTVVIHYQRHVQAVS